MIPLTTVSERIREHIRAGSECGKGYSAALIRLLILLTAQLLCQSGSSFIFSGHLLLPLKFISRKFLLLCSRPWRQQGNEERKGLQQCLWPRLFYGGKYAFCLTRVVWTLENKSQTLELFAVAEGKSQMEAWGVALKSWYKQCFLDICKYRLTPRDRGGLWGNCVEILCSPLKGADAFWEKPKGLKSLWVTQPEPSKPEAKKQSNQGVQELSVCTCACIHVSVSLWGGAWGRG